RPGENRGAPQTAQIDLTAPAVLDLHADEGAAAAVLRIREASEIAPAAEVAIAELVAGSAQVPRRVFAGRHSRISSRWRLDGGPAATHAAAGRCSKSRLAYGRWLAGGTWPFRRR